MWTIACTLLWYICGKNAMAREKKRCSLFPPSFSTFCFSSLLLHSTSKQIGEALGLSNKLTEGLPKYCLYFRSNLFLPGILKVPIEKDILR